MKTIYESLDETNKVKKYQEEADKIRKYIPEIFATPSGWLNAATGVGEQHDVWGTSYAIYIDELTQGDYRKGEEYGSPWECFHPDRNWRQNPVYMATVTLPFAGLKEIGLYD